MWRLPYGAGQVCVREDLVQQELAQAEERYGAHFVQHKLTNRFLDWLFRRYSISETSINFYDDEPSIPDDATPLETFALFRANEERRMTFNNWTDMLGAGIWGMS